MEGSNKRLIVGLAAGLGSALLVIAFLLGRVTAKPVESVKVIAATPAPPTSTSEVTAVEANPAPTPIAALDDEGNVVEATPLASSPFFHQGNVPILPPVSPGSATSPPPSADRTAIASYFAEVERMEDMGAGDPQAFANTLLQSVSSGDYKGFDDLLARARSQAERIRGLTPPAACVEHHKLALTLAAKSISMLERLRSAIQAGDSSVLMAMTTEGRGLEAQVTQLKAMGEGIKRQAGL